MRRRTSDSVNILQALQEFLAYDRHIFAQIANEDEKEPDSDAQREPLAADAVGLNSSLSTNRL